VPVAPLAGKNRSPMERQGMCGSESCADCGSNATILHPLSPLTPFRPPPPRSFACVLASNNQFAVTATKMCVTKLNTNIFPVPCDRLEGTKGKGGSLPRQLTTWSTIDQNMVNKGHAWGV